MSLLIQVDNGITKPKRKVTIDDVIPYEIKGIDIS